MTTETGSASLIRLYRYELAKNKAYSAIKAAKHAHIWGRDAARRYCVNRGILGLYRIARQCELLAN